MENVKPLIGFKPNKQKNFGNGKYKKHKCQTCNKKTVLYKKDMCQQCNIILFINTFITFFSIL